jgi:lysyl-tRNA synthetase class 2
MRFNPVEQYSYPETDSIEDVFKIAETSPEAQFSKIAGRVISFRGQGGIAFADVRDRSGEIQVVADEDTTPDFSDFSNINVGDVVYAQGEVHPTNRGQTSVFASDWARVAATERSMPDPRKGLTDPETIARRRYLDLLSNPQSLARFKARTEIVSGLRHMLDEEGFMEVETPILQPLYGGASAKPFVTHHNALDTEMYLRIAPELYLKRLIVGGLEKVYEIGKDFRNEGMSTRHNPEFTMLESYAAGWDYENQMDFTERAVEELALKLHGTTDITYQGETIDLSAPWRRSTMEELVQTAVDEPVRLDGRRDDLMRLCDQYGIEYTDEEGNGALLAALFDKLAEKDLRQPTFVTEYPIEVSPLARQHRSKPNVTERFEGIVVGRELCNGFSELNDATTQYERFLDQERKSGRDDEAMRMDTDYVEALRYGMPPTAGLGIGIDRLTMLLTDAPSIRDVILFPTVKKQET